MLDKLTYAGRAREPRRRRGDRAPLRARRHRGPATPSREAIEGADAIVNFAAETHVDRSIDEPDAFIAPTRSAPTCCSRPPASAALRYVQVSTDEVYGSIDDRLVHRGVAAAARRARTRRARPAPTCWSRPTTTPTGSRRSSPAARTTTGPYQYPEKLIPLMVLNALARRHLPVYGDGMQVRNWIYVEDFARGIGHVLEHGAPARSTTSAAPTSARTSRSSSGSSS